MPCSPRMTKCKLDCLHRARVTAYKDERIRQVDEAWEAALGYQTEFDEYVAQHPLITFHEYLKATKNPEPAAEDVAA